MPTGPRSGRAKGRGSGGRGPSTGGGGRGSGARGSGSGGGRAASGGKSGAGKSPSKGGAGKGGARKGAAGGGGGSGGGGRPVPGRARGLGGEQVEGRQAVRELLLAGTRRVREVLIAVDPDEDIGPAQDLADLAADVGVGVRQVTRRKLDGIARTDAPQGVVAMAAPLPEHLLEELLVPSERGAVPFLLAVDGVTDPGNLGALLRSAECAGVTGVVLPRHRAVHVTPAVTKAAAGAVEHLPIAVVGGLPSAVAELRRAGVTVIGMDMAGVPLHRASVPVDQPVCLVLGSEGKGISRLVRERCDEVLALPLLGQLASLNVAAAGAVACYEVARRRLLAGDADGG